MTTHSSQAKLLIDLKEELKGLSIISVNIGADRQIYVLACPPAPPYGTFTPKDYTILQTNGTYIARYDITSSDWFAWVQPLPDNEFLLAGRYAYSGPNGKVFSIEGEFKREFILGYDIGHVQTTGDGHIWTSYQDTGVAANQNLLEESFCVIAANWDKFGNKVYAHLAFLHCYAMNVTSNSDMWLYYHSGFLLVHLRNHKIVNKWQGPIRGSHHVAIWQDYVLFCGSYENRSLCYLYQLHSDQQLTHIADYEIYQEDDWVQTRGSQIIVLRGTELYRVDLEDIILTL